MPRRRKQPVPPPRSGYVPCACRDCMELAIQSARQPPAFCHACSAAGCPDYQGQPRMTQECQAPGAYQTTEAP